MKIIEAMKKVKDLTRKAEDLRKKLQEYAADLDVHTPTYANQAEQVSRWLQAHEDITQEILGLKVDIQRTNLATEVTIELGGKAVTKNIAAWIHRRRSLAEMDKNAWECLSHTERRGQLKEGTFPSAGGDAAPREVKIRRYYEPEKRDKMMDLYRSEPTTIDGVLEVTNAITELVS